MLPLLLNQFAKKDLRLVFVFIHLSVHSIDHSAAESQYTEFKFWISESEDHYKPELAQLLYPLFTHLYISLLLGCPASAPPTPAMRFHKRHLATFLGNPEFKQFIQQLAEVSTAEELEQNPSIASFRAAKYGVTLTERTYRYLVRYLETSDSGLLLQLLNQEVEIIIGDPLGSGGRQELRAGMECGQSGGEEEEGGDGDPDGARARLETVVAAVRGSDCPPSLPSIALYRVTQGEEGAVSGARCDERGGSLALAGRGGLRLLDLWGVGGQQLETGGAEVRLAGGGLGRRLTAAGPGCSRELRGHAGPVYSPDWVREGGLLSAGADGSVRLWDRESGAALAVYRGHNYPVWSVRSDRVGSKFASGGLDRTVRLWYPEFAHPLRVYCGHEGSVDAVAWHPNCNYILSASQDTTVRMWNFSDSACVR